MQGERLRLRKVLDYFKDQYGGALPQDLQDKIKYAKWKAADIRTAIKEGRKPLPGGPADRIEGNEEQKIEDELGLNDPPSNTNLPQPPGGLPSAQRDQDQFPQPPSLPPQGYSQYPGPPQQQNQYQSQPSYPQMGDYKPPPPPPPANLNADDDDDDFPDVPIPGQANQNQKQSQFQQFAQVPSNLPSVKQQGGEGFPELDFPSPPKLSKLNSSRWGRVYPGMRVLYQEQGGRQPQRGVVVDCKESLFYVKIDYTNQDVVALEDELAPDLGKGANVVWTQNGISHMCQIQDILLTKWPPQYTLRLPNGLTQKVSSMDVMVPDQQNDQQKYQGYSSSQYPPPPPNHNDPFQQSQIPPPPPSGGYGTQDQRNLNQGYPTPGYSSGYPQPGQSQPGQQPQYQQPPPPAPQGSYPSINQQVQYSAQNNTQPQGSTQGNLQTFPTQSDQEEDHLQRNPRKVSVTDIDKAQKFTRYAVSSLNFNDVESAVNNLEKALNLLKSA